jgi:hypothetical protein
MGQPDLGYQPHQHVIVVRDRGQQGCVRGVDVATELAPEVEPPGRIEAQARCPEFVKDGLFESFLLIWLLL